jgi:hypothetical protein
MQIDLILVFIVVVLQIALGTLWFSQIMFGKAWMKLNHVDHLSKEEMKEKAKGMRIIYALNFLTSLVSIFILAVIIKYTPDFSGVMLAVALWLGFNMPAQATVYLWDSHRTNFEKMNLFLIANGYQLVSLIIAGYLLANFG